MGIKLKINQAAVSRRRKRAQFGDVGIGKSLPRKNKIDHAMILFVKLFLAHLLGDFLLQPTAWVKDKEQHKHRSLYLYYTYFYTEF